MNVTFLIGNLTKDPEVRSTTTGKKLVKFSIAIKEGKRDGQDLVQYFNVIAWDRTAEIIESYVKKGHKVAIVGTLQNKSWDKPDGTKGYATEVTARQVELLTTKADADRMAQIQPSFNPNQSSSPAPSEGEASSSANNANPSSDPSSSEKLPEIDINEIDMPF